MLSFHILDVIKLKQQSIDMFNSGRNFSALSFRFHADTLLKTETDEHHLTDNAIAYFPARLNYHRISKADEMIVIQFDTVNYQSKQIEFFYPKNPEPLASLFHEIFDQWSKKEIGYQYRCASILYEIFAECYAQNFVSKPQSSKIQKSVDYILSNYKNSDLSMREIADQSYMSEVYFRKLFRTEYGISPQKHIINLRIQHAAGLISTGYYSLKEVAHLSGYTDYKYFSVEFKKKMGLSPSEYLYNYK